MDSLEAPRHVAIAQVLFIGILSISSVVVNYIVTKLRPLFFVPEFCKHLCYITFTANMKQIFTATPLIYLFTVRIAYKLTDGRRVWNVESS